MQFFFKYILFGMLTFVFVGNASAAGQDEWMQSVVDGLLEKINAARANPRAQVELLGLDEDAVRAVFAAEDWILDEGLPPLTPERRLQEAALDHGEDMLSVGYYGHISPQGSGVSDRIAAAGYSFQTTEETLVGLALDNYLDPESAVDKIFSSMVRDELLGTTAVARNIFSSTLTEVGLAFVTGTNEDLSYHPYLYLLVADFATPATIQLTGPEDLNGASADRNDAAYLFWQLVNDLRAAPAKVLPSLGVSLSEARVALGSGAWVLEQPLPPLAWNSRLQGVSQEKTRDMLAHVYYAALSSDGRGPEERIEDAGYVGRQSAESMAARIDKAYKGVDRAQLNRLLAGMVKNELFGGDMLPGSGLFSADLKEMGVSVRVEKVSELAGGPYATLVVADYGEPEQRGAYLVGTAEPGLSLAVAQPGHVGWQNVGLFPGGMFQVKLEGDSAELLYWKGVEPEFVYSTFVQTEADDSNVRATLDL